MELLLHICCGPCLIYPFKQLKEKSIEVKGLYYNPNIFPEAEFKNRLNALETLNKDLSVELENPGHNTEDFFKAIGRNQEASKRCLYCYLLRLRKTASIARSKGILNFSTTLLVSPYQNHQLIKDAGEQVAKEWGVKFYYEDFRPGFKDAYKEARRRNLYLQKYCGCKFSNEKK